MNTVNADQIVWILISSAVLLVIGIVVYRQVERVRFRGRLREVMRLHGKR